MRTAVVFSLCLIAVACSGVKQPDYPGNNSEVREVFISASSTERPGWITVTPPDADMVQFLVGVSNKSTSEQGAANDAIRHATSQFIKSCGVKVKLFDSYVTSSKNQSTGSAIEQEISGVSQEQQRANAFVSGLKIDQRYTEKYQIVQGSVWLKNSFWVALLVKVPKDQCQKIKLWAQQYKDQLSKDVERLVNDAKRLEAVHEIKAALNTVNQAEQLVKEANLDPEDIGYLYSSVVTLQKKYEVNLLDEQIKDLLQSAMDLEEKGHILAALNSINQAKELLNNAAEKKSEPEDDRYQLTQEEKRMLENIRIRPWGTTQQLIEPGMKPEPFGVVISYWRDKTKSEFSLANFPVIFESRSTPFKTNTGPDGKADLPITAATNTGVLNITASLDGEKLDRELSPSALEDLKKKQKIRFQIEVRAKNLAEKAEELVEALSSQVKSTNLKSFPLDVALGSFQFEEEAGCSSPFLQRFKSLVDQKATGHQTFRVRGNVRIPKQIPAGLDPNREADQAKIIQSTVLHARMSRQNDTM
ncbi:MAG: hypothetical protein HQ517_12725, partial [SAR324 cluster bacterium]|nr:hypothetical protein [SAR324 cluster bacterium]